jgi:hypothetical protein
MIVSEPGSNGIFARPFALAEGVRVARGLDVKLMFHMYEPTWLNSG